MVSGLHLQLPSLRAALLAVPGDRIQTQPSGLVGFSLLCFPFPFTLLPSKQGRHVTKTFL